MRPSRLDLVLTCVVCGRPIVLTAGGFGISLPSRDEFLTLHAQCLERRRVLDASPPPL